jgi:rhomboid protease GluP
MNPTGPEILRWGANFGPSVVFDGLAWRLFTCMFLHFGLIHLALNMYCLGTAGPLIERFFGHATFAALYVLSGLGGSIASIWVHPTYIGAGASGAIFGIFGGLLGYLAVRHREVPAALLKPMRTGAVAFIGYNMLFGLGIPGIDMAAHLGGLASGFACGLFLTAVAPARARDAGYLAAMLRRSAVVAVLATILAGLTGQGITAARVWLLADPRMGPLLKSQLNAAPAWNAFRAASGPVFLEFDRIALGIDQISAELGKGPVKRESVNEGLDRLKGDCNALGAKIPAIPAENAEILAIRNHLAVAQSRQVQALDALGQFVASGNDAHIDGPRGYNASTAAYIKEFQTIGSLRDAYLNAHNLRLLPKAP